MPARRYPPRRNAIEITPSPSTARRQAGRRRVSARLRQLERAAEDVEVNITERLNRIRGILGGSRTVLEPDAEPGAEPDPEPDPEPMNPTEQALRGRILELELEVEDSKNEIERVRQSYEDWLDICPFPIIRDRPYRGAPRAVEYRPPTPPRPNNAVVEDVPPENIARMQQDFIDKAKVTYQMAKEQYRKTLRKYQGIAEERDDQGRMYLRQLARQRIQHRERANRTFVEEPSRTPSPDLSNIDIAYQLIGQLQEDAATRQLLQDSNDIDDINDRATSSLRSSVIPSSALSVATSHQNATASNDVGDVHDRATSNVRNSVLPSRDFSVARRSQITSPEPRPHRYSFEESREILLRSVPPAARASANANKLW